MANLIESMGYSLGKVHSGLLAYVVDLSRNGTGPLLQLLSLLNIPVPNEPIPYREWKVGSGIRLDVVIFNSNASIPSIIFEIKVDDHEPTSNNTSQTARYADATESVPYRLFVTLGHGEYYYPPDKRFRWVRLEEFSKAVREAAIAYPQERPICDWAEALENETKRRNAVKKNDRSNLENYRPGSWNIIFLGQLKEILPLSIFPNVDPHCYTYGTRPDTILNFGEIKEQLYSEINNNGKLNVKISFNSCQSDKDRTDLYKQVVSRLIPLVVSDKDIHPINNSSSTMTVASIDIGLSVNKASLQYTNSQEETVKALMNYLKVLYT